jgi:hypothetical protein
MLAAVGDAEDRSMARQAARCVAVLVLATELIAPAVSIAARPLPPAPPGLPSQAACPTVANVDLGKIARRNASREKPAAPQPTNGALDEVAVPPDAARRPPPDASFIARVRLPPGGGYAQDERAVVWRERDGSWWGWRKVLNGTPSSPPPPPVPGSPEEKERERDTAAGYPWLYDSAPSYEGRLNAEQSARLEAAFADPCRRLEPDQWPWEIPLLRREKGSRVQRCQVHQDATFYSAEFREAGRAPRAITLRCGSAGTLNGVLVTGTAHVELPQRPARRLTREEIDALRRRGVHID